jgi:hypothetical protein
VDRVLLTGPAAPAELAAVAERLRELLRTEPAAPPSSNGNGNGNGHAPTEAVVLAAAASEGNGASGGATRRGLLGPTLALGLPTTTLGPTRTSAPLVVDVLDDYHAGTRDRVGLLPVVPRFAAQGSVRWLEDFARATGWPVLGALALDGRSHRRPGTRSERETRS